MTGHLALFLRLLLLPSSSCSIFRSSDSDHREETIRFANTKQGKLENTYCEHYFKIVEHINFLWKAFTPPSHQVVLTVLKINILLSCDLKILPFHSTVKPTVHNKGCVTDSSLW